MLILSLFESFSGIRFYGKVLFFSCSKLVANGSGGGEEIITIGDLGPHFLCLILGVFS